MDARHPLTDPTVANGTACRVRLVTGPRVRRLLALMLLGAAVVRIVRALQGSPTRAFDRPLPPLRPKPGLGPRPTEDAASVVAPEPPPTAEAASADSTPGPALAPADVARSERAPGSPSWAAPVQGHCPDGYPVKAKLRSGIFHLPGMSAYERTTPDRCYPDADAALADGLRIAQR